MRRAPRTAAERGIALAVAVFALVVVGVLVASAFFFARLEQRAGANAAYAAEAAEAADAGIAAAVAGRDSAAWAGLAPGSDTVLATATLGGPRTEYTAKLRRINDELYLVTATGRRTAADGSALAERTHAQLVRIEPGSAGATTVQPLGQRGWTVILER
jgi:hypothetical protein